MFKVFGMNPGPDSPEGETILGVKDLGTHACYLIYGEVRPGQSGRLVRPGAGHEEICCLASGQVEVVAGGERYPLSPGQAFYLKGEDSVLLDNVGAETAVYIVAGGHTPGSDHHHAHQH